MSILQLFTICIIYESDNSSFAVNNKQNIKRSSTFDVQKETSTAEEGPCATPRAVLLYCLSTEVNLRQNTPPLNLLSVIG